MLTVWDSDTLGHWVLFDENVFALFFYENDCTWFLFPEIFFAHACYSCYIGVHKSLYTSSQNVVTCILDPDDLIMITYNKC